MQEHPTSKHQNWNTISLVHVTAFIMPPEALSDAFVWRLTSVCLMSVAYIGPNSTTDRPRKTKIGTEVAHVARDLENTSFNVKRAKVNLLPMS